MRARVLLDRLRPWIDELPALLAARAPAGEVVDPETASFCVAALRRICDEDLLARKVAAELCGAPWAPVGRVLVVVSENDLLGGALALLGACATGNRVRIKARYTRPLLESLARALAADCEVVDWGSDGQDDDAILADVDAVLVAGGDAVVRHYRRVAPAHVRLVEWGPKLSAAAIGPDADVADPAAIDRLVADVTLFGQRVCSSPQIILVDPAPAGPLHAALAERLPGLPRLADDERLAQHVRACQLELLGRLDASVRVQLDRTTGWGVTTSRSLDPARRLHRGFPLVVGEVAALLAELAARNRRRLQTLGTWAWQPADHAGFTRVCPIGAMHARSPLQPHDGAFELTGLVDFLAT
jgi:hypothetical protein